MGTFCTSLFLSPEICVSASCIPGPSDECSTLVSLGDPCSRVLWEIRPCDFKKIIEG